MHRDDISIACEISVTSTPEYETQNLAKCLRAGFPRVWSIASDQKRRRAIEEAARKRLPEEDFKRVEFLTMQDIVTMLDALPAIEATETLVRGYKVKVSRASVTASEAWDRRTTIARVVARSMQRLDDEPD